MRFTTHVFALACVSCVALTACSPLPTASHITSPAPHPTPTETPLETPREDVFEVVDVPFEALPVSSESSRNEVVNGSIQLIEDVRFRFESTQMTASGRPLIRRVAVMMQSVPELTRVGLVGYASRGERNASALALARANVVRDELIRLGISPTRIEVQSAGASQFLTTPASERNRRVAFVVVATTSRRFMEWSGVRYEPLPDPYAPQVPTSPSPSRP